MSLREAGLTAEPQALNRISEGLRLGRGEKYEAEDPMHCVVPDDESSLAQDSWERYKPRTLNQIIKQHAPELVKVRGLEKVVSIISSDTFPSRVKAIYTGESRSISAKKKELIFYWVKSFGYRLEIADLFESELSFKEGSVEYWLPVQKQVSPYFAQELKKGDEVTLLLIWVGVRESQSRPIGFS